MHKDVLLINMPYWFNKSRPIYSNHPSCFPMGLGYLAALLDKNGIRVEILDLAIENMSSGELRRYLEARAPSIVGISSMSSQYGSVKKIVKIVKGVDPHIVVVCGGIHASLVPISILNDCASIDYVLTGEAEYSFPILARNILSGRPIKNVPGIFYRTGNIVKSGRKSEHPKSLDDLPYPAYHLSYTPIDRYFRFYSKSKPGLGLISTRGCPHRCPFCSTVEFHGRLYRRRSVVNVINEMKHFEGLYGVKHFSFVDDSFASDRKRLYEMCENIKINLPNFSWGCSARLDDLNEETMHTMAKSGCKAIFIGIETFSSKVQEKMDKKIPHEKLESLIALSNRLSIQLTLAFIVGFPGETSEDRQAIIKFVRDHNKTVRDWRFSFLKVYPGTEYWKNHQKYGIDLEGVREVDPAKLPRAYLASLPWNELLGDVVCMYQAFFEGRTLTGKLSPIIQPQIVFQ